MRRFGKASEHHQGKDVLIGLIDVGGFDFAHQDFLDGDKKTRFECIWDQGGELHEKPAGFDYGSVITKADMDRAIAAEAGGGLPAQMLEPQSRMEPGHMARTWRASPPATAVWLGARTSPRS